MFGSSIIDIAIGIVFVYLLLSLICSAANEIIERYSRKRASDLENGIKEMLQDPQLVQQLYEHPLVYSLFAKPYTPGGKNLPSYIPSRNFALALMDLIGDGTAKGATAAGSISPATDAMDLMKTAVNNNQTLSPKVKRALQTLVDASQNPARLRENIENWFDSSMDRVSGFYKRRSQLIILVFGLLLTIAVNADSIALVRVLSTDRAMRDSLVAAAAEYAKNNPTPPSSSAANPNSSAPAGGTTADSKPPANTNSNSGVSNNANTAPAKNGNSSSAGSADNSNIRNVNSSSSSSSSTASGTSATSKPAPAGSACDTPECRVKENLNQIERLGLPIGWNRQVSDPPDPRSIYITPGQWVLRVLGWLITALALSLGAPFWFDLLNKFMVVRSTVKPKEKSPEEKSKD
jgi:hypothetical protein